VFIASLITSCRVAGRWAASRVAHRANRCERRSGRAAELVVRVVAVNGGALLTARLY